MLFIYRIRITSKYGWCSCTKCVEDKSQGITVFVKYPAETLIFAYNCYLESGIW